MLDGLEAVDPPVESPKCIRTRNEQEPKALAQNYRNQTVQFGKSNDLILSEPTTVRGVAGLRQGAPPLAKWHLDSGEA
jgi:hypothetical protein